MLISRASFLAAMIGVFAVVGCNGFGRVVDPAPVGKGEPDDSEFVISRLSFHATVDGVAWWLDGRSTSTDEVVFKLNERLKRAGGEKMRVVVVTPKNWNGAPNPSLLAIRAWAKEHAVSLRMESATSHVRGVRVEENT